MNEDEYIFKVLMLKNNVIVIQIFIYIHIYWIRHSDFYFFMHNYRANASIYVEEKKIMSGYYYFQVSHSQISTNANFKINQTTICNFHYLIHN